MDKGFRCSECHHAFLADDMKTVTHPGGCYESDYGVYDQFLSHNYYSAYELNCCPECGVTEEEATFTSGYFCNLCEGFDPYMDEDDICCEECGSKIWDRAMKVLAQEFRPDELDYIKDFAKDIIEDTKKDWFKLTNKKEN